MAFQLSVELVDTHCHLNFEEFGHDRDSVVERARKNGITRILNPGIDIETSKTALMYARKFAEVYAAIGVHPNQGSTWTNKTISELRELACEQKVVAIGEIGLDYYRDWTPKEIQKLIFEEQLELSAELGLPVIIHNRNASDDMWNILLKWHDTLLATDSSLANRPGVLHSFSGDATIAAEMVGLNFKLGISGPITFKNSETLQTVVIATAAESLFIETDAPYLTPHPFRGKRNEPANVRIVAEKIAELKDEPLEIIAKITSAEADKLFGWREFH